MRNLLGSLKLLEQPARDLLAQGKSLWQRKRIWIILLAVQILLNIIGQILPSGVQIVLMGSSGAVLLTFSGYAVYTQRSNILVMLLNIMLLYFNYSLVAAVYWNTDALDAIFAGYSWNEFLKCINIELLFYGAYALLLKDKPKVNKRVYLSKGKANYLIVAMCTLYIAAAPFLFYHTEKFGVRGTITPLYEYALIVMILGLCFCRRDVKAIAPLLLASGWIILHGLMHGERILALQMVIVWGLYLLLHMLSVKLIIPACVAGVLFFTIFGIFRGAEALDGNFLEITLQRLLNGGMANDTSYYAYWAGMSINRFAGITPFYERIFLFIKYIGYVFLGSVIPDVNLSWLASSANYHLGGGWLPFYVYCWLGPIGVLLSGIGLAVLINKVTVLQRKRKFCNYLSIYLVATAPRWYLYAPATITRGVLFFSLFYYACAMANKWMPFLWERVKGKLGLKLGKYEQKEGE